MPPNTAMTIKDLESFIAQQPRPNGGLSKAASALRRAEEERQAQRSVFNQPREVAWRPDHERPGGHALEAPMISPDDLFGTGIPTKIAMAIKGAAPLVGGLGVIKNKGGNWLTGSVEGALSGLKQRAYDARNTEEAVSRTSALNSFIDKQLTRYVKNAMATPEDPIRALAERGVLHFAPQAGFDSRLIGKRTEAGFPGVGMGKSPTAQSWEGVADQAIAPRPASYYQGTYIGQEENPWMMKLAPSTPVHDVPPRGQDLENLGFSHLTDELANALNPESGLPRHLLLDPKSMDRVSVPQAVERVSQINAWRAAQKAEADMLKANNAATHLHKDYPDKGFRWVELRQTDKLPEGYAARPMTYEERLGPDGFATYRHGAHAVFGPDGKMVQDTDGLADAAGAVGLYNKQALQDALKYEGDTMGHCVGGYCDDVASGRTKIYSLRDAKGQPHTTVEVRPPLYGKEKALDAGDPYQYPSIVQIKGKQNRAPNEEYLPFVQDFVKSGKWSDVGDLQNSGLQRAGWAPDVLERMKAHGIQAPEYGTADEINAALNALNKANGFAHGGTVDKNNLSVQQLQAIIAQLRQEHINAA